MKLLKVIYFQNMDATMNNFYHNKGYNLGMTQSHVEPPPIPLIKVTYDGNSDKVFAKLKLRIDPMSSMSYLYEFRMSLFYNGNPEEFLLFVLNSNTTLKASGMLDTGANIHNFVR